MRYICNKKGEPVFEKDCKSCPEYNPCAKNGKWCFVGALIAENEPICNENSIPNMKSASAPIMRDTSIVTINLGNGCSVDVLREDIKKQLELNFHIGLI